MSPAGRELGPEPARPSGAIRRTVRAAQSTIIALLPADWALMGPTPVQDGSWIIGATPTGPRREEFNAVVARDMSLEVAMDKLEAAVRLLGLPPRWVN
jgi:hypothetical protein